MTKRRRPTRKNRRVIKKNKMTAFTKSTLFSKSTLLTSVAAFAFSPVAFGQLVIDNTTTSTVSPDTGETVTVAAGVVSTAGPDNIELDNGADDVTVTIAGTLINTDAGSDENAIVFVDNGEENTLITVDATGILQAADGAIYFEGNNGLLTNDGLITGTGDQNEGTVFFDRDAENNTVINNGIIESTAGGAAIGVDLTIEGQNIDGGDGPDDNTETITNTGIIRAVGDVNNDGDGININGDPGSLSSGVAADEGLMDIADDQRNCGGNVSSSGPTVLLGICSFDGVITNTSTGLISTDRDDSSAAGIRFEDDAVFNGTIVNDGTIEGVRNGIRFGGFSTETIDQDVPTPAGAQVVTDSGTVLTGTEVIADVLAVELAANPVGAGTLTNSGTIQATGAADGRGIRIGSLNDLTITNNAAGVISGSAFGIELESSSENVTLVNAGTISSATGTGLDIDGEGHTFTSSGTILGVTNAVNA